MAHSFNRLHTRHTPEMAFDFISDFRHAPLWDRSAKRVTKLTDGSIGQGTRFLLRARLLVTTLDLPYEIEVFERPNRVVFAGSTHWFRYRDEVTFTANASGTTIEYSAFQSFQSILAIGNPVLARVYQRIGDNATRGIGAALDRAVRWTSTPPRGA
jgi:hypothetical protein